MSKLSTNEVGNSVMLMTMVSAPRAEQSKALEIIMSRAAKPKSVTDKVYDVRVTINGVEVDFLDFAAECNRQLDTLVAEAAEQLIRDRVDLSRLEDAVGELAHAARGEAARLLGVKP